MDIRGVSYMKKLAIILISVMVLCSLVGCRKVVDTQEKEVEVEVTDAYYRAPHTTYSRVGKTYMSQVHPAEYRVYVEYDGAEYTISGQDVYEVYKELVGETAVGVLKTVTYDDGSTSSRIVELK